MKVGILGSGDVGRALGGGFAALGYDVKLGTREPTGDKAKAWLAKVPKATAGTFAEAAAWGELVVLATAWSGTDAAIKLAGPDKVAGKVVMDITNPLTVVPNAAPRLALGNTDSGGEQVQRWLPKAKVVKVFNSVGHALMFKPELPGGPAEMFLCGNDESAKKTVGEIATAFGWKPMDMGSIEASRFLEPLCILWVTIGFRTGGWNHAFKLVRK